jgi:hypothetical protein
MARQYLASGALGFPDRYSRNARLYPSLLLIAPVAVCILAIMKPEFSWLKTVCGLIVAAGGTYWLSQLARDPGKNLEPGLWKSWGGAPSIAILRHSDSRVDPITKSRYHNCLCELVRGTSAPTEEAERADPISADICYAAWSTHLRNSTRDQKRFHLLFDELVSYGYRRNLLGLRPLGIASSSIASVTCAVFLCLKITRRQQVPAAVWLATGATLLLFLFWLFRVSGTWVRLPADNYAGRLVEAVDDLHHDFEAAQSLPTAPVRKHTKRKRNSPAV